MPLTADQRDLIESATVAHVATIMPDGAPHSVPVWVGTDGEFVVTAGGQEHRRHANLERDPRISLSVVDPENPYRSLSIRGEAAELSENGALEFLDRQAKQLWDVDEYPFSREKDRYLVKIRPTDIADSSSTRPEDVE